MKIGNYGINITKLKTWKIKRSVLPRNGFIGLFNAAVSKLLTTVVPTAITRLLFCLAWRICSHTAADTVTCS